MTDVYIEPEGYEDSQEWENTGFEDQINLGLINEEGETLMQPVETIQGDELQDAMKYCRLKPDTISEALQALKEVIELCFTHNSGSSEIMAGMILNFYNSVWKCELSGFPHLDDKNTSRMLKIIQLLAFSSAGYNEPNKWLINSKVIMNKLKEVYGVMIDRTSTLKESLDRD